MNLGKLLCALHAQNGAITPKKKRKTKSQSVAIAKGCNLGIWPLLKLMDKVIN